MPIYLYINYKMKGTKVTTKEIYGYVDPNIALEKIRKDITDMTDIDFINNIKLIRTYDERKELLTKRGFEVIEDVVGRKELYYLVVTVNLLGKVEEWYKRKPFTVIKKELLSNPNIVSENPYSEFTVFDDNGKPHTFYKKNWYLFLDENTI